MENINSGRSSPIRGRTMKEYEQQISSMKKENFNLKLRIYFLEQSVGQKFNNEDIIKTNIELNVVCESYKKDLEEKKILLDKASNAIETMTSEFDEKLEQGIQAMKHGYEDKVEQANKRVEELEDILKDYDNKQMEIQNLQANLEDRDRRIISLTEILQKTENEYKEFKLNWDQEKQDLEEQIESLSTHVSRKDRDIKRLSIMVEDKNLVEKGVNPLERSKLKDAMEDAQKNVAKMKKNLLEKYNAMKDKDEMIGNLEDLLRNKEKDLSDKEKELEKSKKEIEKLTKLYQKFKEHLSSGIEKEEENKKKIAQLNEKVERLTKELDLAEDETKRERQRISELEEKLKEMAKSLGKKGSELDHFKEMLKQAQTSLTEGEEAVQTLQRQLEQERQSRDVEKKESSSLNSDQDSTGASDQQTFLLNIHTSHLSQDGTALCKNSEVNSQEDNDGLQKEILELQAENRRLQNLLDATEQTAHSQTHKMKHFQRLLAENGLLPPAMQRSNSDQNLARERNLSPKPLNRQKRFRSLDRLGPKGRSNSPSPLRNGTENSKLVKEEQPNQHQSPNTSLNDIEHETKSSDLSLSGLTRLFEMIQKLLLNTDDNQATGIPQRLGSPDVRQLRASLAHMSCLMRSILESESNFGRESPDSGCSDNPTSLPNNLKSPMESPNNSDSADNSPRSERRRVSRTSRHSGQTDTQASSLSSGSRHLENTQLSEIERNRACSDAGHLLGTSILKGVNMSSVFLQQDPESMTENPKRHSVRFSDGHMLQKYSPTTGVDMDESICRTMSQSSLADLTGIPDHDITLDNTMCKTLSRSRLDDMSGIPDLEESISTHLLDITNTARLESDDNLERLNRIINSYENEGGLDHDAINKYMEELRLLRKQLENQLRMIQRLQEQLRIVDVESTRQLQQKDETIQMLNDKLKEKDIILKEQVESISKLQIDITKEAEKNQVTLYETEKRFTSYINESRDQEKRLTQELNKIEQELQSTVNELNRDKTELQVCKDTIDEQTTLLCAKDSEIKQLRNEISKRDSVLQHQNELCKDLEGRHEMLTMRNKEISSQMEEQKLNCADYRKQIEKQNMLIKELKERGDKLREELSQSINERKSLEKEAVTQKGKFESDKTKMEKLKYNINFLTTEYRRIKYKLQTAETRIQEKSSEIGRLKAALETSQKLIDVQKLTDDEKHNYICLLLEELKQLKEQLKNVIDQNDQITQQLIEIRERARTDRDGGPILNGSLSKDINVCVETNISVGHEGNTESFHSTVSSLSNTWPSSGRENPEVSGTGTMTDSLPLSDRSHQSPHLRSYKSRLHSVDNLLTQSLPLDTSDISKTPVVKEDPLQMGHFSVPGPIYKQQVTDECLLYNVNDSPRMLAGLTRYKIDSDQRSLFAIAMIDNFEKLKKDTHECQVILKGLICRITERLKTFANVPASESIEYGTLKELSFSVDNLRVCVDSQLSNIAGFWTSELPNPNEKGELVNYKLLDEKAALEEELAQLKKKFRHLSQGSVSEEAVFNSLESTLNVVSQARKNLEQNRH